MDKQAQDKRWNELSEDSKKFIKYMYDGIIKEAVKSENQKLDDEEADGNIRELWSKQSQLIELFGYDNLNSEPQIKEWRDVKNYLEIIPDFKEIVHNLDAGCCNQKVTNKIIATYKISRIIELGYGGMVSEEEYDTKVFWNIVANRQDKKAKLNIVSNYDAIGNILTFRSYELAYEFMSHESNRKLVEQYYLL